MPTLKQRTITPARFTPNSSRNAHNNREVGGSFYYGAPTIRGGVPGPGDQLATVTWMSCPDHGELCLSKISKCLSAWQLVFLHNSSRCSFFSRHSSHLWPRSSGRVLRSGSRTWLYAIKSACSTGLQENGKTLALPLVGGLHHRYERRAA